MMKQFLILATVTALALAGCAPQVDIEAEKAAIRELTDVEWLEAGQAKNLDRWMSFYTDDTVFLPPKGPVVTGKEAMRELVSNLLSAPGYVSSWETTRIEVARSGDLAYSYGPQQTTLNDADGNPVTEQQKWVVIWKKQADGSWKCAAMILNSAGPIESK